MIYTAFADYGATGEGTTLMVLISRGYGPGSPEENVRNEFADIFGGYMAMGCEIHEGLRFDLPFMDLLVSPRAQETLKKSLDAGNVRFFTEMHLNFS